VNDQAVVRFGGVRSDWTVDLGTDALLKTGVEGRLFDASFDYQSRAVFPYVDSNGQVAQRTETVRVVAAPNGVSTGGWLGFRHRLSEAFTWETGLRLDHQSWTGESSLGPRLMLSWAPGPSRTLRASVGRYSQSQQIHELQVADGESTFTQSENANMVAVGVEQRLGARAMLRVDAYARLVDDPRPEWVNLSREVNFMAELEADRAKLVGSKAKAVGLELALSGRNAPHFDWSASYTWARADIEIDERWVPRTLDQRHTVNLFGALTVSDRWQLSASWQLHTGWPFTDQSLDATLVPNVSGPPTLRVTRRFGPLNAERLPTYHRLDLRMTRTWAVGDGQFELYLDVFNAYDRQNLRGYSYGLARNSSGGFTTTRGPGEGQFPLLPTVGVRWTF
jgi:hypothetical protein